MISKGLDSRVRTAKYVVCQAMEIFPYAILLSTPPDEFLNKYETYIHGIKANFVV
jgi:hypothetical protein